MRQRQWKLFLSRFLLGLWVVVLSSYVSLIVFETRSINVGRPVVEVSLEATGSVNEVAIPGRSFTCTTVDLRDQCQAEIQGRRLVLTLIPDESNGFASSCKATYGGQPVGCYNNDFGLGAMIQRAFQIRNIELDTQQLKAVRRRYWGLNMLLDIGEVQLVKIGTGLASRSDLFAYFAVSAKAVGRDVDTEVAHRDSPTSRRDSLPRISIFLLCTICPPSAVDRICSRVIHPLN